MRAESTDPRKTQATPYSTLCAQVPAAVLPEWNAAVSLILLRVYNCLKDFEAFQREAAMAPAMPALPEPAKLVLIPGVQALAFLESGRVAEAARAARADT